MTSLKTFKGLSSEDMFRVSDINVESEGEKQSVAKKIILGGKEMSENINDAKTETICFTLRSTEHAQNYIK